MTAVPIQSALSRVMVKELALPATLVAILAASPSLFSPLQVALGSFTDRHPLLGRRRVPGIILGIILCAAGLAVAPHAAFLLESGGVAGLAACLLAFGAWGIGFNVSSVSYFSLAAELLSRMLEPYSPGKLERSFLWVAGAAVAIGLAGTIGLEPRSSGAAGAAVANLSLMLDMTTGGRVGLFMGAWGMADALGRLGGSVLASGVRDAVSRAMGNPGAGYLAVFGILALFLCGSLVMLSGVDVARFRRAVRRVAPAGIVEASGFSP